MQDALITTLVVFAAAALNALVIRNDTRKEQSYTWFSLLLHAASALAIVWVTREVLGGGDMFYYHQRGVLLAAHLREDFLAFAPELFQATVGMEVPLPVPVHNVGGPTGTMACVAAWILFALGDSLYAACMLVGVGAHFSQLAFYRVLRDELVETPRLLVMASCLLMPSVIFWSSALLKESVVMSGLGLMMLGGHFLASGRSTLAGIVVLGLGSFVVYLIKPYILVPFGVAAGCWYYFRSGRGGGSGSLKRLTGAFALSGLLVAGTMAFAPQYSIDNLSEEVAQHQIVGQKVEGGSNFSLSDGDPEDSPSGQWTYAPLALFTALFRPVLFEVKNAQMALNALETTLISVLFLMALLKSGVSGTLRKISRSPILVFCSVFSLGLGLGVGLSSTNLGSLSRYRVPMVPFFTVLLVALTARSKRAATAPEVSEPTDDAPQPTAAPLTLQPSTAQPSTLQPSTPQTSRTKQLILAAQARAGHHASWR